jgi:hypothetical protein
MAEKRAPEIPENRRFWSIRAPKTTSLFFLAVGALLLCGLSDPMYYPAAVPVLGPDGLQLKGPDGKPLFHRDMTKFYHLMIPAFIFLGLSMCFLLWWLIRIGKFLLYRFRGSR